MFDSKTNIGPFDISIHALVKRATPFLIHKNKKLSYFNPRPREEGDAASKRMLPVVIYFNPRPREEGDCYGSSIILEG